MSLSIRPRVQLFHIIGVLPALLMSLLLAVGLSGCNAVKMSYNNAPELSYWWLDSYLDFGEAQSLKLRADLTALQAWHRQSELPAYLSTLDKLQRMAPSSVTPEQVCSLFADLKSRFQLVLDQTESASVALAPTLKAEQLSQLARQFDKRNQKWRDEWQAGSASERSDRRLKQLTDRAEMFYGRLEEAQLAVLRASVALSVFDANLSYRETVRRQQDTLHTLRRLQTGTPTDLRTRDEVRTLRGRLMNSPDAVYRNYAEKMSQESCRTFAALHNSTTSAQRLKVIETLRDYEADVRLLMATRP